MPAPAPAAKDPRIDERGPQKGPPAHSDAGEEDPGAALDQGGTREARRSDPVVNQPPPEADGEKT